MLHKGLNEDGVGDLCGGVWLVLKSLAILSPYGLWGFHRQREDSRYLEREAAVKR